MNDLMYLMNIVAWLNQLIPLKSSPGGIFLSNVGKSSLLRCPWQFSFLQTKGDPHRDAEGVLQESLHLCTGTEGYTK